ncbi:MAG: hypothetical protein J2P46_02380 [Zavarzinella sp.]|nr:hypothetical protein [Zavarzinella sp.]
MTRLEENGTPVAGNGPLSREALEQRVRELEHENRELRARLQQVEAEWEIDRDALEWYERVGMPESEAEMLERVRTGPTISDVMAECEREFADGQK